MSFLPSLPDVVTAFSVCVFRGVSAVPLYVAAREGMFEDAGLTVEIVPTRSSDELMKGLLEGRFHVVHCNPDNIIAWKDRTGIDVRAWIGGAVGPIMLIAGSSIGSVGDLRGTEIAVDAVRSGWSPILRRLLADGGLSDTDYRLAPMGATGRVFSAVAEGRVSAAMVSVPWWLRARDEGLSLLVDHRSVLPRLQGSCGASRADWIAANEATAVWYLRALIKATTWMYQAKNLAKLAAIVEADVGMTSAHAAAVCETMLNPGAGWPPSLMIDARGMELVAELRGETLGPPLGPSDAYYTLEPYQRAIAF